MSAIFCFAGWANTQLIFKILNYLLYFTLRGGHLWFKQQSSKTSSMCYILLCGVSDYAASFKFLKISAVFCFAGWVFKQQIYKNLQHVLYFALRCGHFCRHYAKVSNICCILLCEVGNYTGNLNEKTFVFYLSWAKRLIFCLRTKVNFREKSCFSPIWKSNFLQNLSNTAR